MYTDYVSTFQPAEEREKSIGMRLLSDTPVNMPCTSDMLRKRGTMARQPPPPLAQYDRWQQQPLTYAFASHFPDVFFKTLRFTYIEDSVNSPELSRYAAWVEGRGTLPDAQAHPPT